MPVVSRRKAYGGVRHLDRFRQSQETASVSSTAKLIVLLSGRGEIPFDGIPGVVSPAVKSRNLPTLPRRLRLGHMAATLTKPAQQPELPNILATSVLFYEQVPAHEIAAGFRAKNVSGSHAVSFCNTSASKRYTVWLSLWLLTEQLVFANMVLRKVLRRFIRDCENLASQLHSEGNICRPTAIKLTDVNILVDFRRAWISGPHFDLSCHSFVHRRGSVGSLPYASYHLFFWRLSHVTHDH